MQQVQLEIAKLEAEVKKIQAEAAVNIAKVQDITEVDPQLRMQELQAKVQINEDQLNLRRELSESSNLLKENQSQTSAATKLATTAFQQGNKQPTQER